MNKSKSAIIISIGTELTEGVIQDTHLRYLSQQLRLYGIKVEKALCLPDVFALIKREAVRALNESDVLIFTGGLGPTSDDLTRDVIADVTGSRLVFNESIWDSIVNRFKGRRVAGVNKRQAMVPVGFEWIRNDLGTAPGLYGKYKGRLLIALPGPPRELRWVFENGALPRITEFFDLTGVGDDTLKCSVFMTPESELEESLANCRRFVSQEGEIKWGTRVTEYYIEFSIKGGNRESREGIFECLRDKLGAIRVRRGVISPQLVLFNLLKERGVRLITVESCTGGLVGKLFTDIPGSSKVYWGGLVVYSNEAKERLVGIDREILSKYGAVSEETVEALARGALNIEGLEDELDLSIAISGVAGPEGGSPSKPVGTVFIGVGFRNGVEGEKFAVRGFKFFGDRDSIRRKAAVTAMLLAENLVLGEEWLDRYCSW